MIKLNKGDRFTIEYEVTSEQFSDGSFKFKSVTNSNRNSTGSTNPEQTYLYVCPENIVRAPVEPKVGQMWEFGPLKPAAQHKIIAVGDGWVLIQYQMEQGRIPFVKTIQEFKKDWKFISDE